MRDVPALAKNSLFALTDGGFDFHSDWLPRTDSAMLVLGHSLKIFMDDLTAMGVFDDVVIVTATEFGRTLKGNGTQGTDHGIGYTSLIAGGKVNGGVYGDILNANDLLYYADKANGDAWPRLSLIHI